MLKLETREDLEALHHNQVQESSSLEYKGSPSVDSAEPRKSEIAKDVSAIANADGGQIIYGMTEVDHLPAGLDNGVDPQKYDGLWFEQVIQQNIRPQIENLRIKQVHLGNGNVAVVLTIPAAVTRAPHQVKDGKYYRRRNFRNDVMEDYEIREAMHRTTTPDLFVKFELLDQPAHQLALPEGENPTHTLPCKVRASIGNRSRQPSYYTVVSLYTDSRLEGGPSGFSDNGLVESSAGQKLRAWRKLLAIPGHLPIFSELPFILTDQPWGLIVPIALIDEEIDFAIGYMIATPGFIEQRFSVLRLRQRAMTLVELP